MDRGGEPSHCSCNPRHVIEKHHLPMMEEQESEHLFQEVGLSLVLLLMRQLEELPLVVQGEQELAYPQEQLDGDSSSVVGVGVGALVGDRE